MTTLPAGFSGRELLGAPTPADAARRVVLALLRAAPRAVCLWMDPNSGRLVGTLGHRDESGVELEDVDVHPEDPDSPFRASLTAEGGVPTPWIGEAPWGFQACRVPREEEDPGECLRIDCPARYGQGVACASGPQRWTCGLSDVVGLVGATADVELVTAMARRITAAFHVFRLREAFHDLHYFREDVFDSMTEGLIASDLMGRITMMNRAAELLVGMERHEAIARPVGDVLREEGEAPAWVSRAFAEARPVTHPDGVLVAADGRRVPVRVTSAPITARGWGRRGVLFALADVSALHDMQQEIRRLDRLATLGRFTSAVAHEVRNPLGGILAGVQYLKGCLADRPANREHIGFIEAEIGRLNRIVEDLFTVTRNRRPNRVRFSLLELWQRVGMSLGAQSSDAGVVLAFSEDPPDVYGDPDQLHQTLLNIVKNAIEACQRGGAVSVSARLAAHPSRTIIDVEDSGGGIDERDREHLFEPFYSTKGSGTGLGLYVCHRVVENHQGTLTVSNGEEGGSRFTITLPLDEAEEEAAA